MSAVEVQTEVFSAFELALAEHLGDNLADRRFKHFRHIAPFDAIDRGFVHNPVHGTQIISQSLFCATIRKRRKRAFPQIVFAEYRTMAHQDKLIPIALQEMFSEFDRRGYSPFMRRLEWRMEQKHPFPIKRTPVRKLQRMLHDLQTFPDFGLAVHAQKHQQFRLGTGSRRTLKKPPLISQTVSEDPKTIHFAEAKRFNRLFPCRRIEHFAVGEILICGILVKRSFIPSVKIITELGSVLELSLDKHGA